MASVFNKIIQGEIPSHKIIEDESFFAFLDIRPINPGHTLVVPKKEEDYFFDLDSTIIGKSMIFAKNIVPAIEKSVECKRVGVIIAGLEVPHAHIHLVPIISEGDLTFSRAKAAPAHELETLSQRIRDNL